MAYSTLITVFLLLILGYFVIYFRGRKYFLWFALVKSRGYPTPDFERGLIFIYYPVGPLAFLRRSTPLHVPYNLLEEYGTNIRLRTIPIRE